MVLGAAVTTVSGLLIAYLTRAWPPMAATGAIAAVLAGRLLLIQETKRRIGSDRADLERLERAYVLGASAYLFCIGSLTFSAFAVSGDAFVLTLAVTASVTHAFSIAVRNYPIRRGIGLQIVAFALPLAGGSS